MPQDRACKTEEHLENLTRYIISIIRILMQYSVNRSLYTLHIMRFIRERRWCSRAMRGRQGFLIPLIH